MVPTRPLIKDLHERAGLFCIYDIRVLWHYILQIYVLPTLKSIYTTIIPLKYYLGGIDMGISIH